MWRFASLPDLQRVLKAVMVSVFGLLLMVVFTPTGYVIPRSMTVLYPVLLLLLMGGGRVAWRMWKEPHLDGGVKGRGKPVANGSGSCRERVGRYDEISVIDVT